MCQKIRPAIEQHCRRRVLRLAWVPVAEDLLWRSGSVFHCVRSMVLRRLVRVMFLKSMQQYSIVRYLWTAEHERVKLCGSHPETVSGRMIEWAGSLSLRSCSTKRRYQPE